MFTCPGAGESTESKQAMDYEAMHYGIISWLFSFVSTRIPYVVISRIYVWMQPIFFLLH